MGDTLWSIYKEEKQQHNPIRQALIEITIANRYLMEGRYDSVKVLLRRSLEKNNDDPFLTYWAIDALSVLEEYSSGLKRVLEYADLKLKMAQETGNQVLIAKSFNGLGTANQRMGNRREAYENLYQGLELAYQISDTAAILHGLSSTGSYYIWTSQYAKALEVYLEAKEMHLLVPEIRTHGLSGIYANITSIYLRMGNLSQAEFYSEKSIRMADSLKMYYRSANNRARLANILNRKGNYNEAITITKEILKFHTGKKRWLRVHQNHQDLGSYYHQIKKHETAIKHLDSAIEIGTKHDLEKRNLYPFIYMGESQLAIGNLEESETYLQKALKYSANETNWNFYSRIHKTYSLLEKQRGNFKEAYYQKRKQLVLIDSLAISEQRAKTNELEASLSYDSRKASIKSLVNKYKEGSETLSTNRKQLWLVLLGLGILLILLYSLRRLLKKNRKQKISIENSVSEKDTLLREIHHRVKNNLQVISSLLNLQSRQTTDSAALEALNEGKNRVKSMALIHQNLYQQDRMVAVETGDYIERLVRSLLSSYKIGEQEVKIETDIDPLRLDVDMIIPLGLILNELISNSLKYAFPNDRKGNILVQLKDDNNNLKVLVKDDGIGIPKDLNLDTHPSLGMRLIRSFGKKLNADLTIKSQEGTSVFISIPKKKRA